MLKNTPNPKKSPTPQETKIIRGELGILGIIIVCTTLIHHIYPSILSAPSISSPFDAFGKYSLLIIIFYDISAILLGGFTLYHAIRTMGLFKGFHFFIGSFLFAGIEENIWILTGRFGPNPSYFFTTGGLWFFEIPVYTCLGWYILSYSFFTIIRTLLPHASIFMVANLVGLFAMNLDLWLDPILVNIGILNEPVTAGLWVWENLEKPKLFSIPIMNFMGWWLVVTCFTFHFQWIFGPLDTDNKDPLKIVVWFFILFPIYWILIFFTLHGVEWIIDPWWGDINNDVFPIHFTEGI